VHQGVSDLGALELLVAVADLGSLGRAARRYQLTQPAVSMRMTTLEQRLGVRLLVRDPSGTRLTPEGQQVVAAARELLASAERLGALADRLRAEATRHLRVAASFTVAEHLLPLWAQALRQGSPESMLSLDVLNSSRVLTEVVAGHVDLGFVEGTDRHLPQLASRPVASDRLVVVVAPTHPWARRRVPVSGPELAEAPLVVREPGSGTREVLDEALRPYGGVRPRMELGSSSAVVAATRRGEGPGVLSALAVADELAAGDLVEIPVDPAVDLTRRIRAVWLRSTGLAPLARRLLALATPKDDSGRVQAIHG
jgi:DNA-binding transcriptional LysR family regulator